MGAKKMLTKVMLPIVILISLFRVKKYNLDHIHAIKSEL